MALSLSGKIKKIENLEDKERYEKDKMIIDNIMCLPQEKLVLILKETMSKSSKSSIYLYNIINIAIKNSK